MALAPVQLAERVRSILNEHGHAFHFSTVKALHFLHHEGGSPWKVDAVEFPIDLPDGGNMHIDIVLRSTRGALVIECKRANPSLSTWCFARSRHISRSASNPHDVLIDFVWRMAPPEAVVALKAQSSIRASEHQYHVAFEVKDGTVHGDAGGRGRGAIDDALTQALRGAAGLIDAYATSADTPHVLGGGAAVVPTVITTARLFTVDVDLSDADLATGQMPAALVVTERPWVWYRAITSSRLRPRTKRLRPNDAHQAASLGSLADREYARSIAVVSTASGLVDFLEDVRQHTE